MFLVFEKKVWIRRMRGVTCLLLGFMMLLSGMVPATAFAEQPLPVRCKAIAAGDGFSLALKTDGTVMAWGSNENGRSNVPAGLSGVKAIAAGGPYALALKSDGTVVAWGHNDYNQLYVPEGLSGVVAISAGRGHALALKSDGTVVGWWNNYYNQSTAPAGLSGVLAVAAGGIHSLALKSDGTVLAWGGNEPGYNQTDVPAGLSDVVAIDTVFNHSLALKSNGTVVAWGKNFYGETDVPAGLSDVVAISAGGWHSLALKSDGTVVAWGYNDYGQSNVPAGLSDVVAISAGDRFSLALKRDGTVVAWGDNSNGQTNIPDGALSGLSIDTGILSPSPFNSSVTGYTQYVSPTATSVNITATLASPTGAALYINDQMQASGTPMAISLTGVSTDISVRTEPYLKEGKTYSVNVIKDSTAPAVNFGTDGSETWAASAATTVTVSDGGSGVDASTLKYAWTTDTAVPSSGWASFTSGDTLTKSGVNGDWYLHIQASDKVGNTANAVSGRFRLDSTAPAVDVTMTKADNGTYTDNTWTNQSVTVHASATDAQSGVTSISYSLDGGVTWSDYTSDLLLQSDDIYSLSFKTVDTAGNITIINRTVKISANGLNLTPTLTKTDGSAYTSGSWTDSDVTVSVHAEAGPSSISSLTYSICGGAAQSYTNQSPIAFNQEGMYTITFQVSDVAGNTLSLPLNVNIDRTVPTVNFSTNSSETWTTSAASTVTVADGGSGVDAATLKYAWSTDTAVPLSGWTSFTNGDTLTKSGVNGDWNLYIQASDTVGNMTNAVLGRSRLDETEPVWPLNSALSVTNRTVNSFTLNWPVATDNIGIGCYKIYSDGNLIATVAASEDRYTVAGLAPGESHTYHVKAADAAGNTADGPSLAVSSNTMMTLGLSGIPEGTAGEAYSLDLSASGGQAPYTYSASGLPAGLSINNSTGLISGTPAEQGLSSVTSSVYDSLAQQINITFEINIHAPVVPDTTAPTWPIGAAITVSDKSLNALTLNWPQATDNTGISGYRIYKDGSLVSTVSGSVYSCSIAGLMPGVGYTFGVKAFDAAGNVSTELTLTVSTNSTLGIDTSAIAAATLGNPYSASLAASGGSGPYTWNAAGLPAGLSINASTGIITGTPTAAGTSVVNITLTDSLGVTTSKGFSLSVFYPAGTGQYSITPANDTAYITGTTPEGIKTMTVNSGITGFKYFTVNVAVNQSHSGDEAVVFVQLRNGTQIAINASCADYDQVGRAKAAFNVQPGDIIKVYIVDDLTNDAGSNPTLLQ